ncbi:MAG: endopeptidase La [Clostridia bacterium]|nr:endopeptidase La [Clostridia bacterium]
MNDIYYGKEAPSQYPLLATRGLVVLPGTKASFDVGRKISIKAVDEAMRSGRMLVLSSQKDIAEDEPSPENIYRMGTLVKVRQVMKIADDNVRLLVKGVDRVDITGIFKTNNHLSCLASKIIQPAGPIETVEHEAFSRMLKDLFAKHGDYMPKPAEDVFAEVVSESDLGMLCDLVAGSTFMSYENKQKVLETVNPYERASFLTDVMQTELEVLKMEHEIAMRVKEQIDGNQREYYLKEQLKAIQSELGSEEPYDESLNEYVSKIEKLDTTDEIREKLLKEVERLSKMPPMSHEGSVIEGYLDTVLDMPFGVRTKINSDLDCAKQILDADHYGMEKVKTLVLEHLAVRSLCDAKGQILCLVGPPGVGKTSVARSIAKAMNRNYARIALGGIRDEAEIRGHRRTYIGSMPGRIASAVKKAKSLNPLIILDEIDKLCSDFRGDPASALLEVLDSEQNVNFEDHYLDFPLDLSDVFFVATANTLDTIPRPLLDRMDVVEISTYLDTEKVHIAKEFLIPKQRKAHGLKSSQIRFEKGAVEEIISCYTRESGVRELERKIAQIMRRAAKAIVSGETSSVRVTKSNIEKYLKVRRYRTEPLYDEGMVGIVNGLAWTSVGGELLNVEVTVLEGTGKIDCTGSLGDVMKESVRAAVSFIRSVASVYDIEKDFYKTRDIHVHFPEGAVPKDGPSAGIAIATALMSALSLAPVKNTVAMTGEITLTGRVLPIGGLKEKTMAAYKNGIHTVIIPERNLPDLKEIDKTVYENINFVAVKTVDEVFRTALDFTPKQVSVPISATENTKAQVSSAVLN